MKLIQTTTVNDVSTQFSNGGDVFTLLSHAQRAVHSVRPDMGEHWLQDRSDILDRLAELRYAGRVSIFSFDEQLKVKIRWEWVQEDVPENEVFKSPEVETPPIDFSSVQGSEHDWGRDYSLDPMVDVGQHEVDILENSIMWELVCTVQMSTSVIKVFKCDEGVLDYILYLNSGHNRVTRGYAIWSWDVWCNGSRGPAGDPIPF